MERAGRELGGRIPLLANMVEGGKTPLLSIAELGALGFRLAIHPGAMLRVVGYAATNYLATLRSDGTTRAMLDRMFDFKQLNDVIGTDDMLQKSARYRLTRSVYLYFYSLFHFKCSLRSRDN